MEWTPPTVTCDARLLRMLTHQQTRPLVFEFLRENDTGQVARVVDGVGNLAIHKGLISRGGKPIAHGASLDYYDPAAYRRLYDDVQMILWQLLSQGVLVWGMSGRSNDAYPFYRLTEYGREAVQARVPQPYDPDGFLGEFARKVQPADGTVTAYLEESVRCFNANCFRGAAILLGAASERCLLMLHERFLTSISDGAKKAAFEKTCKGIAIHRTYRELKKRLDYMVDGKKLPHDLAETVGSELPSGFELIRRYRNESGHPAAGTEPDPDAVFLNLRSFIEYSRRVFLLIGYFEKHPADW
jgi:hypothetical protein